MQQSSQQIPVESGKHPCPAIVRCDPPPTPALNLISPFHLLTHYNRAADFRSRSGSGQGCGSMRTVCLCGFRNSDLSSISANSYLLCSSARTAAAELSAADFAKAAQHVLKLSLFGTKTETTDVPTLTLNKLPAVLVNLTTRSDRLKWNSATGQRDRDFMQDCRRNSIRAHIHSRQGSHL